jgi:hypothetical protein
MFKYAKLSNIAKRLASRITVVDNLQSSSVIGMTGTQVGTDLISLIGEATEDFVDCFLSMVYEMELKRNHPFLNSSIEKLIVSDVYVHYFPSQGESPDSGESFATVLRQQGLNEIQSLFDGFGIFIPGSTNSSNSIQNDENRQQMAAKAMVLPGEILKKYIGYDFDGDSISDTDLFKLNGNVSPSFYTTGDFPDDLTGGIDVLNNVRIRPRGINLSNEEISFF